MLQSIDCGSKTVVAVLEVYKKGIGGLKWFRTGPTNEK